MAGNDTQLLISYIEAIGERLSKVETRLETVNAHVMQIPAHINAGIDRHEARCIVRNKTEIGPVNKFSWLPSLLKAIIPALITGGVVSGFVVQCSTTGKPQDTDTKRAHVAATE